MPVLGCSSGPDDEYDKAITSIAPIATIIHSRKLGTASTGGGTFTCTVVAGG
jgi:hypothetical protein